MTNQEASSQKVAWRTWWVDRLEQTQRRVTKLASGIQNTAYGERPGELHWSSLEMRRLRENLNTVCNYVMRERKAKQGNSLRKFTVEEKETVNTSSSES